MLSWSFQYSKVRVFLLLLKICPPRFSIKTRGFSQQSLLINLFWPLVLSNPYKTRPPYQWFSFCYIPFLVICVQWLISSCKFYYNVSTDRFNPIGNAQVRTFATQNYKSQNQNEAIKQTSCCVRWLLDTSMTKGPFRGPLYKQKKKKKTKQDKNEVVLAVVEWSSSSGMELVVVIME